MISMGSIKAWALTTKDQAADGDAAAIAKLCAIGVSLHMAYKMFVFETTRRKKFRLLSKIPGDKPDFLMSELVDNINRLNTWRVESTLERYPGQEIVTTAASSGEVFLLSPRMVETMLKNEFKICGKPLPKDCVPNMALADFVGDEGIFVLSHGPAVPDQDAKWSAQRKSASKIFTKNNFNTFMYDTIVQKSDAVLDVVGKLAKANSEKQTSNVLDIQSTFFSFTFCAIQRIFFNRDTSDSIYGKHDEMQHAFDEAHRAVVRQFLLDAPALEISNKLLPFPLGSLSPHNYLSFNPGFWLWRQFTGHYGTMVKHVGVLKKHTSQILKEVRSLDEDLDGRQDLLAHFFRAKEKFTDKQLSDVILNFILAGRDTTACTLTWFMFELTQNQDVQDKLAEEVRSVIGRDGVPTLDDVTVESMPYMHCCFLETLRMYPPVPEDNKMNTVPIILPDGTSLPAYTNIVYSPYVMGRDPSRYPEPNVFRPERWKGKNPVARVNGPEMYEFPVFQAGPRYCLGLKLAQNETKLLMSRLLQSFKFVLDPAQDPTEICPALMITMSLCNKTFPDVTKNEHELNVVPTLRP